MATLNNETEPWMNKCAGRELSIDEQEELRFWMRHQTLALMMFTSCGWFFDEADGIEPRQILQYAKKLIELTQEKVDWPFERTFLDTLSRISKKENGRVTGLELWESL